LKKISRTISVSIFTIALSILAIVPNIAASPEIPVTTVYIDKPTITATSVGQQFTVQILVDNVTNLNSWQFGLTWNPNLLNSTDPTIDYSWFGPEADTLKAGGRINNTQGSMEALAVAFTSQLKTVNGSGPLASVTFKAKATGTTDIHLAEVKLKDNSGVSIPAKLIDVYTVIWDGTAYPIVTVSNLTGLRTLYRFSNHAFVGGRISFNVTGPDGTVIFLNVTIPKALLESNATFPWAIQVDGQNVTNFIATTNATHTSLYFTYTLSTHKVEIWLIPEFPTVMIIPILIIATFATAALGKLNRSTKHRKTVFAT